MGLHQCCKTHWKVGQKYLKSAETENNFISASMHALPGSLCKEYYFPGIFPMHQAQCVLQTPIGVQWCDNWFPTTPGRQSDQTYHHVKFTPSVYHLILYPPLSTFLAALFPFLMCHDTDIMETGSYTWYPSSLITVATTWLVSWTIVLSAGYGGVGIVFPHECVHPFAKNGGIYRSMKVLSEVFIVVVLSKMFCQKLECCFRPLKHYHFCRVKQVTCHYTSLVIGRKTWYIFVIIISDTCFW